MLSQIARPSGRGESVGHFPPVFGHTKRQTNRRTDDFVEKTYVRTLFTPPFLVRF